MKHNLVLQITSLLSIVLMTLHLTSDTLDAKAGSPEAGGSTLVAVPILVLLLYGTLLLAERRSGQIVMLVGSIIAIAMPVVHVIASTNIARGALVKYGGAFVFVWTLHALALTGLFSLVLATRGLLMKQRNH
jgi:hypothetical protein